MQPRPTLVFILLLGVLHAARPTASLTGQQAALTSGDRVIVVDPTRSTVTTFARLRSSISLGLTMGPDGRAIYGVTSPPNTVEALDLTTGTAEILVTDPTAKILNGIYQPVLNPEAVGGPGIWCIAGGAPATTVAPPFFRTTFTVDLRAKQLQLDALISDKIRPVADTFAHPHRAGKFVAVGQGAQREVWSFEARGGPVILPTVTEAFLPYEVEHDALIHEDGLLYCWSNSRAFFTGFQAVDLRNGTVQTIAVSGINESGSVAAVWNEPWEAPGRIAYVLVADAMMLYKIDLLSPAPVAVAVTSVARAGRTGREIEESQLSTWTDGGSGRTLHLNFGPGAAGLRYVCLPSVGGLAGSPLIVDGLEIWLDLDNISLAALLGFLPYRPQGILDPSGEADVVFDVGLTFGVDATWAAIVFDANNRAIDVSNFVRCKM